MLDVFKYLSWGLTTIVPFVGQWFFKFTEDDPHHLGGYRLTSVGKIALVLTVAGIAISFGLTIISDSRDASDQRNLAENNARINQSLDDSNKYALLLYNQNEELEKQFQQMSGTETLIQQALADLKTHPAQAQTKLETAQKQFRKITLPATRPAMPANLAAYRARILMKPATP